MVARPTGFTTPAVLGPNNLNRIPAIKLDGATGAQYATASWPWNNKADDYQIRDDISWTKGAHQIKMGGSWALYKKIQDCSVRPRASSLSTTNYTGVDFADFLLGYAQSYQRAAVQGQRPLEQRFMRRIYSGQLAR